MKTSTRTRFGFDDLNDQLVERFPGLREGYENELRWRGKETIDPQVIYEDFFATYVVRLLGENNSAELRRAFEFVEVLAGHDDVRVQDVAALAVLEGLCLDDDKRLIGKAKRYMGPSTRRTLAEVRDLWEHPPSTATRGGDGHATRSGKEAADLHFSYEEFNALLPKVFPYLRKAYERELRVWADADPLTIYGLVFSPYLNAPNKGGQRDGIEKSAGIHGDACGAQGREG